MRIIYEPRGRALEYAPLAVSLYRGCAHGCQYCFVPAATKITPEKFLEPAPRKNALRLLERDAEELAWRRDKREILMSFTTDPYQFIEETFGLTRQAIRILTNYGLRFTTLTKAGARALTDIDLLVNNPLYRFGTSLIFSDEEDRLEWEPFAAPTKERILNLAMMHQYGIRTWVSCEPVFSIDQTLELIQESLPYVDEFRIGKLNHLESGISRKEYAAFVVKAHSMIGLAGKTCILKDDLKKAAGWPG